MNKSWTREVACVLVIMTLAGLAHSQEVKNGTHLRVGGQHLRWDKPTSDEVIITYAYARVRLQFDDGIATQNCEETEALTGLLQHSNIGFASFHKRVVAAMRSWEAVARVRFVYTDNEKAADLRIAAQSVPRNIAWTNLALHTSEQTPYRKIRKSVVCLNPTLSWSLAFSGDSENPSLESVMQHEIGHVLGLDHQGKVGARMSYRYTGLTELDQKDINAVQMLYGPRQPLP